MQVLIEALGALVFIVVVGAGLYALGSLAVATWRYFHPAQTTKPTQEKTNVNEQGPARPV